MSKDEIKNSVAGEYFKLTDINVNECFNCGCTEQETLWQIQYSAIDDIICADCLELTLEELNCSAEWR